MAALTPTRTPAAEEKVYDLTALEDVEAYLHHIRGEKRGFTLQRLPGGTANWIYRVSYPGEGRSTILKHAAPVLAASGFELSTARMGFEARFLEAAGGDEGWGRGRESEDVQIPAFHFYDDDAKLLCTSDAGEWNLNAAYTHLYLSAAGVRRVGEALGVWLSGLHAHAPRDWVVGSSGGNNEVGVRIAGYTYTLLSASLAKWHGAGVGLGCDVSELSRLSEAVCQRFAARIPRDQTGVCHGDFWPGNVVLRCGEDEGESEGCVESEVFMPTVIDWELTRLGSGSTDVGQFAAEAYMLDLFRGGKGLLASFVRAYLGAAGVRIDDPVDARGEDEREWMASVAVHFAVHIAVWPSREVHWARGEDTAGLVRVAVGVLRDVVAGGVGEGFWALVRERESG